MQVPRYTIITPTRDRPKLFELCKKYVERQVIKPSQWLVIDDGDRPIDTDLPSYTTYIRREHQSGEPSHTLPLNFKKSFKFIENDYIYIFEDDDWYHPDYVKNSISFLKDKDIIGYSTPIYYHFCNKQYSILHCKGNTSFSCTALNINVINKWGHTIDNNNPFIDLYLWKKVSNKKIWGSDKILTIGLKGLLSGLEGQTIGHYSKFYNGGRHRKNFDDKDYKFLKSNIGEDINSYFEILGGGK